MIEIWKDIKNYEGLYQISNFGRVKSLDRSIECGYGKTRVIKGKILISQDLNSKTSKKYLYVSLNKNGYRKLALVHRLVAQAYISNPDNKPQVNHINGIKTDNRVENLEWVSGFDNTKHAISLGLSFGNPNKKKVRCVETQEIFDSITDAAKYIGRDLSSILKACNKVGRIKRIGGYHWEYLENYPGRSGLF